MSSRDGNLWVVVIVKSCVNKQAAALDWLHKSEQPIRSQVSKLTQLLTWLQPKSFHSRTEIEDAARDSQQLAEDLAGMLARLEVEDASEVAVEVLQEEAEVEGALKEMIERYIYE